VNNSEIFGGGVETNKSDVILSETKNLKKLFAAADVNPLFSFVVAGLVPADVVADFISAFFVSEIFL